MDMRLDLEHCSSPSPSSAVWSSAEHTAPWSPPKRPAGRTKFKETRHPVFCGVQRRGSAGRWVCEVRVPGKRGERLWLGTYLTAEAAARGHDAGMLALHGPSAACLNFPDSARLLAVRRPSLPDLADVRRAAVEAVAVFQRREGANGAAVVPVDEVSSGVSADMIADYSSATSHPSAAGMFEVPAVMDTDMFEADEFGDMDLGAYYANLAEGLLMEPPENGAYWDSREGGPDAELWSY